MEDGMKEYEIAFLLRTEDTIAEVLGALKKHGAEMGFEGALKRLSLAYPVKKMMEAIFGYCHFKLQPAHVVLLEQTLRVNPAVIRFLIITPPFLKQAATPSRPRSEARPREAQSVSAHPLPLSNEDLEKKIGEILQ